MTRHTFHQIAIATAVGIALIAFGFSVPATGQTPAPAVEAHKQLQEKRDKEKKEDQDRKKAHKRVSKQEQQERIRRQQANLELYRKNIALRQELARRNAQVLRQQKRLAHYRFQQEYYERLRQQQAELTSARYDFDNDPYYYTAPNYRYRRDGRYYMTNEYGMEMLERALKLGYKEGFQAGRADREDKWRFDYDSTFAYEDANYGYDGRYIDQDEYNHYFREGFQRGYEDGYYGRQKYGKKDDNTNEWLIAGAVIAAILGVEALTD